jgi:hypothetical protein
LGAVAILLLAILALTTGTYSSLNISQGLNPQPWLLKASVYHSATSAVKQGEKDKTKRELVEEIMNTPLETAKGRNALSKMLLQDLQKSAANLEIDTKKHVTLSTVSGWKGRGKGMLQVLWERGWINVNKLSEYKMMLQDDVGFIIKVLDIDYKIVLTL